MKNIIMAFRWRLKKRGYTNIHIKKQKGKETWKIEAVEPLGKTTVYTEITLAYMQHGFRF